MVGGPAGFHDHQPHITIVKPALKLTAGQALLLDDFSIVIGNSDLEYTLGQINSHGRRMHFGLLSSKTDPHPDEHRHRLLGDEKTGESIPSLQPTVKKLRFLPSAELARWASPRVLITLNAETPRPPNFVKG